MSRTHPEPRSGRRRALRAGAAALALALGPAPALRAQSDAGAPPPVADPMLDEWMIVRLAGDDPAAALEGFILAFGSAYEGLTLTPVDTIPGRAIVLIRVGVAAGDGISGPEREVLEEDLTTNPAWLQYLVWGEFDYEGQTAEGRSGSFWFWLGDDDGPFGTQYASDRLGLPAAQVHSTGRGAAVAVLDTGVDASHPKLAGRVLAGGFDFVNGDADPADTGDGLDTDGDGAIDEMTGHGTFVASLVALAAPEARILPVRVLDADGVGDNWQLARGMFHAIDLGVEVINASLGSTYRSRAVEDAVQEAASLGIVVVGAAGNLDREEPAEYPALFGGAMAVAAVDPQDRKAPFSNFNAQVTISAPGACATVIEAPGQCDPLQSIVGAVPGGYAAWQGTSLASAFVAGSVALVRAQHPEWAAGAAALEGVRAVLVGTAADIDPMNPDHAGRLGAGRIDPAAAVLAGPPMPAAGDLDNDGVVGDSDLLLLAGAWGLTHSSADLNCDGRVGSPDLAILMAGWNSSTFTGFRGVTCADADVNGDGEVDHLDLAAVLGAWGPCPGGPEDCPADIDGNGIVSDADLVDLMFFWGPCPR